jgi:hypothetical protein
MVGVSREGEGVAVNSSGAVVGAGGVARHALVNKTIIKKMEITARQALRTILQIIPLYTKFCFLFLLGLL